MALTGASSGTWARAIGKTFAMQLRRRMQLVGGLLARPTIVLKSSITLQKIWQYVRTNLYENLYSRQDVAMEKRWTKYRPHFRACSAMLPGLISSRVRYIDHPCAALP